AQATTPGVPDTTPPSAPTGLVATALSARSVELSWEAVSDPSGIAHYDVYRDGVIAGSTPTTSFVDPALEPSTTYEYFVVAVDGAGNSSGPSSEESITTPVETLDPDLLLAFGFEMASGADVIDASSNSNNGLLVPNAARTNAGRFGRGVELFGTTGAVELGGLDIPGNGLTIACWVRADDFGTHDGRIVCKANGVLDHQHWWMLSTISSGGIKPRFRLKTDDGSGTTTLIGDVQLSAAEWTHLAATYDGANMRLCVNGLGAASAPKSGTIAQNSCTPPSAAPDARYSSPLAGVVSQL